MIKEIETITTTGATGSIYRKGRELKTADLYVLEGAGVFENNARALLERVLDLKYNIPDDTAVYLPNICLPENLAMLIYMGADVLDTTKATVAAYKDIYLTHQEVSTSNHFLSCHADVLPVHLPPH
jgi:archaeosine synthase